jgi:radical SAM modification target selenobiotic family peptide
MGRYRQPGNGDSENFFHFLEKERRMDSKNIKKLLAGMSLVALLGGAGLTVTGCVATTGSATANGQNDADIDANERDNEDGNLSA